MIPLLKLRRFVALLGNQTALAARLICLTVSLPLSAWAGETGTRFTPGPSSFMGNRGVEPDDRGRIPMWGEEKDGSLLPGDRAGSFRPDSEVKREGKSSVLIIASNGWFAISSVNNPLAPWTERYELSGWTRAEKSASAQLLACWTDDSQKVLRVDAGKPVTGGEEWQKISLSPPPPRRTR